MSRGLTVVSRLRSVSFRSLIFRNGSQTRAGEAELPAPDFRLFWKVPENRNSSPTRRPHRSWDLLALPQWPGLDSQRAPSLPDPELWIRASARSALPRPPWILAGCKPGVASPEEPAPPSPCANRPCDGKSCLAQPCSSVHIWAVTSRALRTCP